LITWQDIRTILDEGAECPQPEGRFSVLLHNVKMRVVDPTAHFSDLLDDGVDSFREGVAERAESRLQAIPSVIKITKKTEKNMPFHHAIHRSWEDRTHLSQVEEQHHDQPKGRWSVRPR
jgi:hypothetical protein